MFKYFPLGDSAFIVKIGNEISLELHQILRSVVNAIDKTHVPGIIEMIPAYNELMICYNPKEINHEKLITTLQEIETNLKSYPIIESERIYIPVCYENEFAPDLPIVAQTNNLIENDVIQIHTSKEYLVYMLGFTPGFCYLGGMDERISTPRKETPRQIINAGSVGIAGNQTGIYPIDSPGGWQIIGKTPLKLFDPNRKPEFLIEAGNYIHFESINKKQFDDISELIKTGNYILKREKRNG